MFFAAKKMGVQKMLRLHNYQVANGIARLLLLPCIACHHNFRMGVTALYVGKLSQARGGGAGALTIITAIMTMIVSVGC